MPFFNLGLRGRLHGGFVVLIAFGLFVAGYGMRQLSVTAESIRQLDAITEQLARGEAIARQLETIRRGLNRYLYDGDAGNLNTMKAAEAQTAGMLADAATETHSEARRQTYSGVGETLRSVIAEREAFVAAYQAAAAERAKLLAGEDGLTLATARLVQAIRAGSDTGLAAAAAQLETAILRLRIANLRLLLIPDQTGAATFAANQSEAAAALTALEQSAGEDIKPMIASVEVALKDDAARFERISVSMTAGAGHAFDGLLRRIVAMQKDEDTALISLRDGFKATSAASISTAREAIWLQAVVAGAATVVGVALAFVIGRGIVRPITRMTGAMTRLAAGDNAIEVPGRESTDEIGGMARAVEVFKQNAIENIRLNAAKVTEQSLRDRRQAAMDAQTQDFGTSVSGVMASLSSSADKMHAAANEMTEAARNTRVSTSGVVEGATASARDLDSVALAAEQMAASINEISRQVGHVTTAVGKAVERASETTQRVVRLSETAERIGDVVRLITDIAGQTNLLALNATIEAARAGEAGKGFAVVASEVKTLATQTARATDQIGTQILAIRASTGEAVEAVRDVGSAISQVAEVATAIAAAVELQAAATKEISSSVQAVTRATAASAQAMEEVLAIAERTDTVSQSVLTAAGEVGKTTGTLRVEVTDFLTAMKRSDVYERRAYERLPGGGATARVTVGGSAEVAAVIRDISRGGIALLTSADAPSGTDAQVRLPGGATIAGRVVRFHSGVLSVAFRQDPATIGVVDRALEPFARGERGLAA